MTHYVFVVQRGRLEAQAALLVESMVGNGGISPGDITAAYPVRSPLWPEDPEPSDAIRAFLAAKGVRLIPFDNVAYGQRYPHANKVYALAALDAPAAVFLDTDMMFLRPVASPEADPHVRVSRGGPTFPQPSDRFSAEELWRAVYRLFGLAPGNAVITKEGEHERWAAPYYNAGWIGVPQPAAFAADYLETVAALFASRAPELAGQPLIPNADQIALPVVIARRGLTAHMLPHGVNVAQSAPRALVWHYHSAVRALHEGPMRYGPLVRDVLASEDVQDILHRDPQFAFWMGEGRAVYDKVQREAETPLFGRPLLHALKAAGAPLR